MRSALSLPSRALRLALLLAAFVLPSVPALAQFLTTPAATTALSGGSADFSFSVQVSGAFADISLFIYRDGTNVSNRFTLPIQSISNVVSTSGNFTKGEYTIRISNLTPADAGAYTIRVGVNGFFVGNPSPPAQLTIVIPVAPAITSQPQSVTVADHAAFTLAVQATGTPAPTYQWYKNGAPLLGATAATYAVSSAFASDAGIYYVVVANSSGSVASATATVGVTQPPNAPNISVHPVSASVVVGDPVTFAVALFGAASTFRYQWLFNGNPISGATSSSYSLATTTNANAGNYSVLVVNDFGSVLSIPATLTLLPPPPTVITAQPESATVVVTGSVSFTVVATGRALTYQWYHDGAVLNGATKATLAISSAGLGDAGSYFVRVNGAGGSVQSAAATLVVNPDTRLVNLSARAFATPDQPLIVGLTVADGSRDVLLRAVGPTLASFGVLGALADPRLDVYDLGGTKRAENEDWDAALVTPTVSAGAFVFPFGSRDAALVHNFTGGRTVHGHGSGSGLVLVEAYALGTGSTAHLSNLSARSFVGLGERVLIAGFVVNSGTKVLIRAVGPTLGAFNVDGFLADPQLTVYNAGNNAVIAANDNWDASLTPTFASVGAFPLVPNSKDAALFLTLAAGSYTAVVAGVGSTTGVALVEIYELP